jgi:hypothetical protein
MKQFIILILLLLFCANAAATDETRALTAIAGEAPVWESGTTSVSGLCDNEKAALGGAVASVPDEDDRVIYAPPMPMYPPAFDWRENNGTTPVKHQGSCGSCWAFGATGAIESKILIETGKTVDLSEQHLISCTNTGSCGGGWPDEVLKYARDIGIPNEACYPYIAKNTRDCETCENWESIAWQIEECVYVAPTTDSFKYAIQEHGPISVVISVPEDWYYYRSGVYEPAFVGNLGWANHAVVVVGWNDSDGCWFIKNCWGENWGENGYARVRYGVIEKYNYAYAVTGIVDHGDTPSEWVTPDSVVASTVYRTKYPVENTIDGDVETHWFSKIDDLDPTLTFDMGDVVQSSAIRVAMFKLDVPMTFDVQVSTDGHDWTTVVDDATITESGELVKLPCVAMGQYFKIIDMHGPRIYTSLSEFAVYRDVPDDGLTLTLNRMGTTEVINIDDLVSLVVSDGNVDRLIWLN